MKELKQSGVPFQRIIDGRLVWMRLDTYEAGMSDLVRCAHASDRSRMALASISWGDYDAACSLCWLNIGHTMDLHAARLEKV